MRRLIAILVLFFVVGIPSIFADAQQTAEFLIAWAAEVIKKAKEDGLEFVLPEQAGEIFYLKRQHYIQLEGTLSSGNAYIFLTADGKEATSLGIEIYDENMNLVSQNVEGSPYASGGVQPEWTGTFYIRIMLLETTGVPAAHVGYIMLYTPVGK
jgi:hypothetical protein